MFAKQAKLSKKAEQKSVTSPHRCCNQWQENFIDKRSQTLPAIKHAPYGDGMI
jgi:hypothetical protein